MSSNLLIRKFLSVSAWQARPRPDTFSLLLTLIARVPVKSSGLACYSMVQRNSAAVVRHDASTRNQRLHFGLKLWHCVIRDLRIQVRLHGQMGLASSAVCRTQQIPKSPDRAVYTLPLNIYVLYQRDAYGVHINKIN